MKRSLYLLLTIILMAILSGCASMSKKDCLDANWQSIGYGDGARGIHYTNLAKHSRNCSEYDIAPDADAYHEGWGQGIRNYCTADNGYRAGSAGQAYRNICPQDVEENFLSGWDQGIEQYCTPDNGLRQGLAGRSYQGVCPPGLEAAFHDYYRLGHDVRKARATHKDAEHNVHKLEKALAVEQDPHRHRSLLHELERLLHEEQRRDAVLISLEACMSDDWFDAGYRDAEDGYARRAGEIAGVCFNYGIGADRAGYREGWFQGNRHYCTYETGLYLGQTNQRYSGVCAGQRHQHFWQGYERGRHIYQSGRYEAHPKPVRGKVVKHPEARKKPLPPRATPKKQVRQPEKERKRPERVRPAPKKEIGDGDRERKVHPPEKERGEKHPKPEKKIDKENGKDKGREMLKPPAHGKMADPVQKHEKKLKELEAEKKSEELPRLMTQ